MSSSTDLNRYIGKHITHHSITPEKFVKGKWFYKTEDRDIILMGVVGKWAMIRRPKACPYVVEVKELILP